MHIHSLEALRSAQNESGRAYHEFLRAPSMSLGIYRLPAGGFDPQQPHREDEVYVVLQGSAKLEVDGIDHPVSPGSIVYVGKTVPHRFHSIEADLEVLVFFAPAETEPAV